MNILGRKVAVLNLRYLVRPNHIAVFIIFAATLFGSPGASGAERTIESFFGDYAGMATPVVGEDKTQRRADVSISGSNREFNIKWSTISEKTGNQPKTKSYSIDFRLTRHKNIYSSEMRANKFGQRVPLNPIHGNPFVWARITGDTLTVHALIITPDGGYDLQVYDRTLTPTGLDLKFTRVHHDQPRRVFVGKLKRVQRNAK